MIEDIIIDIKNTVKENKIPMEIVEINVEKDERETFIENIVGFSWNNTSLHPSTEQLMEIYKNNKYNNRKTYTFFTDGLIKKQDDHAEIGIGWVQIENKAGPIG